MEVEQGAANVQLLGGHAHAGHNHMVHRKHAQDAPTEAQGGATGGGHRQGEARLWGRAAQGVYTRRNTHGSRGVGG